MERKMKNNRPLLSVAVIAKDAGASIEALIASIRGVADELVLVLDDRTTDDTEQLAAKLLCMGLPPKLKVYPYAWPHSFSKARNYAQSRCRGKYVLWMDADEELAPQTRGDIRPLLEQEQYTAIWLPCVVDSSYQMPEEVLDGYGEGTAVLKPRIWLKSPHVKWVRRVHEMPDFGAHYPAGEALINKQIEVHHKGTMSDEKRDYYQALLYLDLIDRPDDYQAPLSLASEAIMDYRPLRALYFLERCREDMLPSEEEDPRVKKRYHMLYGQAYQALATLDPDLSQAQQTESFRLALQHYATCGTSMARCQAAVIHIHREKEEDAKRILGLSCKADPDHLILAQLHRIAQATSGAWVLKEAVGCFFQHLAETRSPSTAADKALQLIENMKHTSWPSKIIQPGQPDLGDAVHQVIKPRGGGIHLNPALKMKIGGGK